MDTLDGLKTVIAVVETGSFTAASERLNSSKALVSKYIGEVEETLGIRLFNRTTRKISLTEAGNRYYLQAQQLLENYQAMVDDVVGEQVNPRGVLRISAPVSFGDRQLASIVPEFCQRYPDLHIELVLNNRAVDMIEEGIDVRIKIGSVPDTTLIARHIYDIPLVVCASPEYLQKQGKPEIPADLSRHLCIVDRNFKLGRVWPLLDSQGKTHNIDIQSHVSADSPVAIANMVKSGGGIGLITQHVVADDLRSGELIALLPDYSTLTFGLYLMYPHRKHLSTKVKCFVEFMQEKFGHTTFNN